MHTDWNTEDNDTREGIATLHTAGDGYWSNTAKAVRVTGLVLGYVSDEEDFGELCVQFNTDDWRVDKDGLIYTDSVFMQELQELLQKMGYTAEEAADVNYSEQGMQGDNYVSCDIGELFLTAYARLN
jgi:hypothetical protein